MGRRKIGEEHIRSLTRGSGGSSYSLILPMDLVKELGWKSKQKLVVKRYGDGLIIKDWKDD
jgi:hypothetical protein